MEHLQQTQCTELNRPSSFYRSVYSELGCTCGECQGLICIFGPQPNSLNFLIEEVGWEHLLTLGEGLTFLTFKFLDKEGRVHVLEIHLDETYPKCPPSISADLPYLFNLKWSVNSRLKDVVQLFQEHLDKLQEFWSTLDDIDKSLWVVDQTQPSHAASHRLINIGNDCFITLSINTKDPRSLPECRFMGSDFMVNSLRKMWRRNSKRWINEKLPSENLVNVLEIQLPRPQHVQNNNHLQVECGICYAQHLPFDDELGAKSGSGTDYTCDNINCRRNFHSICLGDWLRSITTTRQSFNVLFGNCPYCSEPVAVKISTHR
ncbi:uncharacterized protein LOC131163418 isoform X4 [Malania oleifera]|uniref:uncharacterized protein LOC131163418 isoform X4 n=1 Tax=Malania oleifera TaxID=397392 RepID=UPI0025ADCAB2|nr:uncharacterized protein LOC131163418 isoform X4 [Malania oleifera]